MYTLRTKIYTIALFLTLGIFVLNPFTALAQNKIAIDESDYTNNEIEMADTMRSNGKIYIVVATLASIMVGVVTYMVFLDNRLRKLEHSINEESNINN